MKAIRIHEFGGPEVMKLEEVERPVPAADEILVKVYASSVNPADYVIRQGGNEVLRSFLTLPLGLGLDAAGIVEETGNEVTDFKKGDKVYGVPNFPGAGSYAEYIAAKASQFSLMPHHITFNEAGALPSCALIAWNGIVDLGKVQPRQRVLIHGAAGGVGTLAVQFAKAMGGYVIGTASAYNVDFLNELGADEVIDYNNERFDERLRDIDVVFNASPVRDNSIRLKSVDVLKEGGLFVCTHLDQPLTDDFLNALAKKNATGTLVGGGSVTTYTSSLSGTTQLINEGKVKAVVSKVYPLQQVADAHRESETKHVRGKIVLEIRKENEPDEAFKTISEFLQFRQLPKPEHPSLSVFEVESVDSLNLSEPATWFHDFYCIGLKRVANADEVKLKYGQQTYDYDEGILSFISPNQVLSLSVDKRAAQLKQSGWMLLIHPDFLWNTPLAKTIKQYDFWGYSVNEALFLSEKEESLLVDIIKNIQQECHSNIDKFSKSIIISHLETLLNYADRFYNRQFITRDKSSHQLLERLEKLLSDYFDQGDLISKGLPTVGHIAQSLQVSPKYLSSSLKVLTGQNTQQHIHEKLIEKAKEKLSTTELTISEIAYQLGFEHLQSFSKLFKTKTNQSPLAFRASFH